MAPRAVVTGCFGAGRLEGHARHTLPLLRAYAARVGAAFVPYDDRDAERLLREHGGAWARRARVGRGGNRGYLLKALALRDALLAHRSVLWLDDSCALSPSDCDDLFALFPEDVCDMAAFPEGTLDWVASFPADARWVWRASGFRLHRESYVNTGVLLLHATDATRRVLSEASLSRASHLLAGPYVDQTMLNYLLQDAAAATTTAPTRLRLAPLPARFNVILLGCGYDEAGRETRQVSPDFLSAHPGAIFHVTGFYRHRAELLASLAAALVG